MREKLFFKFKKEIVILGFFLPISFLKSQKIEQVGAVLRLAYMHDFFCTIQGCLLKPPSCII